MLGALLQFIYRLAGILIAPLLPFYLKKRVHRGKEDAARLQERFGHASVPRPSGKLVWMHAASVGELQSLRVLISALEKQYPNTHLLVTTGTVTSAALAQKMAFKNLTHQFVPVDSFFAVRRFLRHWKPDIALWVESEFWPELLFQTQKKRIPTLLINARISEKSLRNWQNMRQLIKPILCKFQAIIASTQQDAVRLQALGVPEIKRIANLKFESGALSFLNQALADFKSMVEGRSVILAASTHAGEEKILSEIAQTLRHDFPKLLLVVVPRHATRGEAIKTELYESGCVAVRRSLDEKVTQDTLVYLADTMGELGLFYAACDIAFIGGSLIPHGGHNMLEAARLDCAIVTGAYHFNFTDIVTKLKNADAIIEAENVAALQEAFRRLLDDSREVLRLKNSAKKAVSDGSGALLMIMQALEPLMQKAEKRYA